MQDSNSKIFKGNTARKTTVKKTSSGVPVGKESRLPKPDPIKEVEIPEYDPSKLSALHKKLKKQYKGMIEKVLSENINKVDMKAGVIFPDIDIKTNIDKAVIPFVQPCPKTHFLTFSKTNLFTCDDPILRYVPEVKNDSLSNITWFEGISFGSKSFDVIDMANLLLIRASQRFLIDESNLDADTIDTFISLGIPLDTIQQVVLNFIKKNSGREYKDLIIDIKITSPKNEKIKNTSVLSDHMSSYKIININHISPKESESEILGNSLNESLSAANSKLKSSFHMFNDRFCSTCLLFDCGIHKKTTEINTVKFNEKLKCDCRLDSYSLNKHNKTCFIDKLKRAIELKLESDHLKEIIAQQLYKLFINKKLPKELESESLDSSRPNLTSPEAILHLLSKSSSNTGYDNLELESIPLDKNISFLSKPNSCQSDSIPGIDNDLHEISYDAKVKAKAYVKRFLEIVRPDNENLDLKKTKKSLSTFEPSEYFIPCDDKNCRHLKTHCEFFCGCTNCVNAFFCRCTSCGPRCPCFLAKRECSDLCGHRVFIDTMRAKGTKKHKSTLISWPSSFHTTREFHPTNSYSPQEIKITDISEIIRCPIKRIEIFKILKKHEKVLEVDTKDYFDRLEHVNNELTTKVKEHLKKTRRLYKPCNNLNTQTSSYKKVSIFKSLKHGLGLFAEEFIPQGTFVIEYTGELISEEEAERRGNFYEMKRVSYLFNCIFLNDSCLYSLDAFFMGNQSKFINHSVKYANLKSQVLSVHGNSKIVFYSTRDIFKGEELLFDYQFTEEYKIKHGIYDD